MTVSAVVASGNPGQTEARSVVVVVVAGAVVVLGGVGPFFGSIMFIREQRSREWVG